MYFRALFLLFKVPEAPLCLCQRDFQLHSGYLRAPPPQSNYPPYTVLNPDKRPKLELHLLKGGISRSTPRNVAIALQCLPPILHINGGEGGQVGREGGLGGKFQAHAQPLLVVISDSSRVT